MTETASGSRQPAFGRERGGGRVRVAEGGFWHSPSQLNLTADLLILLASVLFGVVAVKLLMRLPVFALEEVIVVSPLNQVTPAQIEYAAQSALHGSFFTVNLETARTAFEKLPWVREAQLRRRWPAGVEVSLREHQPVAYWRGADAEEQKLLSSKGHIFAAASNARLPEFAGPPEQAVLMLARYRAFNESLSRIGRHVVGVTLTHRLAWQLRLDDGMVIELGRDQPRSPIDARLARLIAHWPQLSNQGTQRVTLADLRYPAGFAVRLAAADIAAPDTPRR